MSQTRHYQATVSISATPERIFNFADDHTQLTSHMAQASWMMGGGRMDVASDEGHGRKVGSHIRMSGKALGLKLFLDEVVSRHEPPNVKVWATVGDIRLLVIGHYRMGFEIRPEGDGPTLSELRVFIDYDLPKSWGTRWLGSLFSRPYAKWCVNQMLQDAHDHFSHPM